MRSMPMYWETLLTLWVGWKMLNATGFGLLVTLAVASRRTICAFFGFSGSGLGMETQIRVLILKGLPHVLS